jgi:hypothetical protein
LNRTYAVDSVFTKTISSVQPYHKTTLSRIFSLMLFSIRKLFHKNPSSLVLDELEIFFDATDLESPEDDYFPIPAVTYFSKIFSRIAMMHAHRTTSCFKKFGGLVTNRNELVRAHEASKSIELEKIRLHKEYKSKIEAMKNAPLYAPEYARGYTADQ